MSKVERIITSYISNHRFIVESRLHHEHNHWSSILSTRPRRLKTYYFGVLIRTSTNISPKNKRNLTNGLMDIGSRTYISVMKATLPVVPFFIWIHFPISKREESFYSIWSVRSHKTSCVSAPAFVTKTYCCLIHFGNARIT